jgi:hypothetical protein
MDMIFVRANFNKDDLIPLGNVETDLLEDPVDFRVKDDAAVLGRTHQMIEQDRDVVALVRILTHEPDKTISKVSEASFGESDPQRLKRINSNPTPSQRAIATNFAAKGLDFIWEPGYALVRRERLSAPREVRLLAPLTVVQWDAYIAAHDAKYTYWHLRPNMADPTIVPLIPQPNHPAYVSNAAIIASAVAVLVSAMFP